MILVTGASGNVGGAAARALIAAEVPFRVLLRDPAKFVLPDKSDVECVTGDLTNPGDLARTLAGISRALLVTANSEQQGDIERSFARAAAHAGVAHLVKVSSMEASPDATSAIPREHFATEQLIKSLDIGWTMLQPNFFMQNLLLYAGSISQAGVFALPMGHAKTGMIDARDVGVAAATILETGGHENRTYELTGDELLSFDDVAARLMSILGKEVRYVDQPPDEFRAVLERFIPSAWHVTAVCELFAQIAAGGLESKTSAFYEITGKAPTHLDQFIRDHADAFA